MHHVAVAHGHAGHVDLPAEIDDVHVRVARPDLPGEQLEARRAIAEVAHRAVRHAAEGAEPLVDRGVDLTPERAEPGIGVEVLDHHHRRTRPRRDVPVVRGALRLDRIGRQRRRLDGADRRGPRVAGDRLQRRIEAVQVLDSEAGGTAVGRHHFERVADRRRVPCAQRGQRRRVDVGHRAVLLSGKCGVRRRFYAESRAHSTAAPVPVLLSPFVARSFRSRVSSLATTVRTRRIRRRSPRYDRSEGRTRFIRGIDSGATLVAASFPVRRRHR